MPSPRKRSAPPKEALSYRHPEADLPARPEIGAQAHFKKAKPPATYRFDSSLAPALEWDGQNPARETAEALIAQLSDFGLRVSDLCPLRMVVWPRYARLGLPGLCSIAGRWISAYSIAT